MIFRLGDFELDEDRFELRHGGEPVTVQRRVLETIFHLVRHRDRLVTRDELCAGPWAGAAVSDSAIAQAIKHAREALGDHGQRTIRTVRGKGVRFVGTVELVADAPSGPTFVGRSAELARLRALVVAARGGRGSTVLIGGDGGIGKTALVDEMVREAAREGVRVFWGRGWEAGGTPAFWPWLELLRGIVEAVGVSAVVEAPEGSTRWVELVPELGARLPSRPPQLEPLADAEHARVRMFDSVTRFLQWTASRMDAVLVLEDLHAADCDSLALLRYAAPRLRASRLLVAGTFRPDELRRRNVSLSDGPAEEVVMLDGLPEGEVAELVHRTAGARCAPAEVAQIQRLAAGNPLMVRELAAALADPRPAASGEELALSERWAWCLGRRIDNLPPATRTLLETAAVAGRSFDIWLIAQVHGIPDREALTGLQPALEQRVVRLDSGKPGTCQFSHVLFRDAVDRRLSPEQRCDLHARCAAALELEGPLDDDRVYRIAHHAWLASPADGTHAARRWALEAARRARDTFAYDAECDHLERAATLGGGRDPGVARSGEREPGVDLLLRLAEAQRLAGRRADAIATLEKAAAISLDAGDARRLAEATIGRFDVVGDAAPIDSGFQEQVARALALQTQETPERAILLALKAFSVLFFRPFGEGRALWEEGLAIARRTGSASAAGRVLLVGVRFCDDGRALLPLADELLAAGEKAGLSDMVLWGQFARCWSLLQLGRGRDWGDGITEYARLATRIRHPAHLAWSTFTAALPLLLSGDLDGAYDKAKSAYRMGLELGDPVVVPSFGCALLSFYRAAEGTDRALGFLNELHEVGYKTLEMVPGWVSWRIIMMTVDHQLGLRPAPKNELRRILEGADGGINRDCNYVPTVCELGRLAVLAGDEDDVERIYSLLLPHERLNAAPMCGYIGPVSYCLGLLQQALGDSVLARSHLERACEDAERVEARPWIEKIRRELGGLRNRGASGPPVNGATLS